MAKTNRITTELSDASLILQIGQFIKHQRVQSNILQATLAEQAGLNRYTVSKIETGASISLSSLIQILRVLDAIHVLEAFEVKEEISPIEYAKLKRNTKQRVRDKKTKTEQEDDLGW